VKIKLSDIVEGSPCNSGMARALRLCDNEGIVTLSPGKYAAEDVRWLRNQSILSDKERDALLGRAKPLEKLLRQPPIACVQIGIEPATGKRFPSTIEELVVESRANDWQFLRDRPSPADQQFGPREESPWVDRYGDDVLDYDWDDNDTRVELSFARWSLHEMVGCVMVQRCKSGLFSCRKLKLFEREWWEIIAAFCRPMMTQEEALAELDRTRPANLR
jgi:hypothetical protein